MHKKLNGGIWNMLRGHGANIAASFLMAAIFFAALPLCYGMKMNGNGFAGNDFSNYITKEQPVEIIFSPTAKDEQGYLQFRFAQEESPQNATMIAALWDEEGNLLRQEEYPFLAWDKAQYCKLSLAGTQPGKQYRLGMFSDEVEKGGRLLLGTGGAPEFLKWNGQAGAIMPELLFFYPQQLILKRLCFLIAVTAVWLALIWAPRSFLKKTWQKKVYHLALLTVAAIVTAAGAEFLAGGRLTALPVEAIAYNVFLIVLIYLLFYSVFRRSWPVLLTANLAFLILSVANYFVLQFRGGILMPADLMAVGTAAQVVGNYQLTVDWGMFVLISVWIFLFLLSLREKEARISLRHRLTEAGCGVAATAVCLAVLLSQPVKEAAGIIVGGWDPTAESRNAGYLAYFEASFHTLAYQKPQGYSDGALLQLAGRLPSQPESGRRPRVIVVMNESWADFGDLGELRTSEDYLPFFHELENRSDIYTGRMVVPVFGGGTSNTEFEALTGFSLAFSPVARSPYTQYVLQKKPSLAGWLKGEGYSTVAMHLLQGKNWSRDKTFPLLGFDDFYSIENEEPVKDAPRGFATDREHFRILWKEIQALPSPVFHFSITIQNHGGYTQQPDGKLITLQDGGAFPQLENYMTLAKGTDTALQEWIEKLEMEEEPTIFVMFGDHFPGVEKEAFDFLLGGNWYELPREEKMRLYETPVVIWSNFDAELEKIPEMFSANYLQAVVLELAGLPKSPFQQFLWETMQTLPVFSQQGFVDAQGIYYEQLNGTAYEGLYHDYSYWQYGGLKRDGQLPELFYPVEKE